MDRVKLSMRKKYVSRKSYPNNVKKIVFIIKVTNVIKVSILSSVSAFGYYAEIFAGFVCRRSVGLTSGAVSLSLYCQQISKLGEALNSIRLD